MEEKPLNEKESLELITQMIRIHRRKWKREVGYPSYLGLCDHCRLIGGVVSACPYRESLLEFSLVCHTHHRIPGNDAHHEEE